MRTKIICDEMLAQLGKWLRAAGYDTTIAGDRETDRQLLERAIEEGRHLITRDHKLMEFRHAAEHVLLLRGNSLEDWIVVLDQTLDINWLLRPFTRCLICNTPLVPGPPDAIEHIPEKSRRYAGKIRICPQCDKLFWEGSHVKRMHAQLRVWEGQNKSGSENNFR